MDSRYRSVAGVAAVALATFAALGARLAIREGRDDG